MSLTKISWQGSEKRSDGANYKPADRKGYDVSIRPVPDAINDSPELHIVETVISKNAKQTLLLENLQTELTAGHYVLSVREIDSDDRKSGWTTDVPFEIVTATPTKPSSVEIS